MSEGITAEKRSEGRAWHRALREGLLGEAAFALTSEVGDGRHT